MGLITRPIAEISRLYGLDSWKGVALFLVSRVVFSVLLLVMLAWSVVAGVMRAFQAAVTPTTAALIVSGLYAAPILLNAQLEHQSDFQESMDVLSMTLVCPTLAGSREFFDVVDYLYSGLALGLNYIAKLFNDFVEGLDLLDRAFDLMEAALDLFGATVTLVAHAVDASPSDERGRTTQSDTLGEAALHWLRALWRVLKILERLLLVFLRSMFIMLIRLFPFIPRILNMVDDVLRMIYRFASFVFKYIDPMLDVMIKIHAKVRDVIESIMEVFDRMLNMSIPMSFRVPVINRTISHTIPNPFHWLDSILSRITRGHLHSMDEVFRTMESSSGRLDEQTLQTIRQAVRAFLSDPFLPGDTFLNWVEAGRVQQSEAIGGGVVDDFGDQSLAPGGTHMNGDGGVGGGGGGRRRQRGVGVIATRSAAARTHTVSTLPYRARRWFPSDDSAEARRAVRRRLRTRPDQRHTFMLVPPAAQTAGDASVAPTARQRHYSWRYGAYVDQPVAQDPLLLWRYAHLARPVYRASMDALRVCLFLESPELCERVRRVVASRHGAPVWLSRERGLYRAHVPGADAEAPPTQGAWAEAATVCSTASHYGDGSLVEAECALLSGSPHVGEAVVLDVDEDVPLGRILVAGAFAGRARSDSAAAAQAQVPPQLTRQARADAARRARDLAEYTGHMDLYELARAVEQEVRGAAGGDEETRRSADPVGRHRRDDDDDDGDPFFDHDSAESQATERQGRRDFNRWWLRQLEKLFARDVTRWGKVALLSTTEWIDWLLRQLFECPFNPLTTNDRHDYYIPGCVVRFYWPPESRIHVYIREIESILCPFINWPVKAPLTCRDIGFADEFDTLLYAVRRFAFDLFHLGVRYVLPTADRLRGWWSGLDAATEYMHRFDERMHFDSRNLYCFVYTAPASALFLAGGAALAVVAFDVITPIIVVLVVYGWLVLSPRSIADMRMDGVQRNMRLLTKRLSAQEVVSEMRAGVTRTVAGASGGGAAAAPPVAAAGALVSAAAAVARAPGGVTYAVKGAMLGLRDGIRWVGDASTSSVRSTLSMLRRRGGAGTRDGYRQVPQDSKADDAAAHRDAELAEVVHRRATE